MKMLNLMTNNNNNTNTKVLTNTYVYQYSLRKLETSPGVAVGSLSIPSGLFKN